MDVVDSTIIPSLLLVGASGSGRRRLAGALAQSRIAHVDLHDHAPFHAGRDGADGAGSGVLVHLVDTPGPGGEDPFLLETARPALESVLASAHVLIFVVDYPTQVPPEDVAFLRALRAMRPAVPLLALCSGVDRAFPEFKGAGFNPDARDKVTLFVREWQRGVGDALLEFAPHDVALCAAGASGDPESSYNLDAVSDTISRLLPASARLEWQCLSTVTATRAERADKVVLTATAVAGGIGAVPLPVADMPFIITTQVTMLAGLFRLYGRPFGEDALRSLVLAGLSAVVGPLAFGAIVKVVPGLGSIAGGGVAAACTYAVGEVACSILESGGAFEVDDFKAAVRKVYDEKRDLVTSRIDRVGDGLK